MILDWMQLMTSLAQKMKFIMLIIKEIINFKNPMPVVISVIFNQSFMVDSVQDFGYIESI